MYPLRLGPLFPNDIEILKPKVGLKLNQIEIDLRKAFLENKTLFMNKISYFGLKKDHGNPRACIHIHAYAHAYSSSTYACFIHAYAYILETMKYKFSISLLLILFRSSRNGRNISYQHANRYHNTLCSTSSQISAYFGLFQPFQPISVNFS